MDQPEPAWGTFRGELAPQGFATPPSGGMSTPPAKAPHDPGDPSRADSPGEPAPLGQAELAPTTLADLAARAREQLTDEPDRHRPAAIRALAAVVRDLKGMPGLLVTREGARIRIVRAGRVGALVLEYRHSMLAIEVQLDGFPSMPPGVPRSFRYTLQAPERWVRLDPTDPSDLFDDLRERLLALYPELRPTSDD